MKEDLIIRQLNIITKWMDAVNEKAKSIHELSDIDNTSADLYVAVSDGQNTGKILFPLNTITDDEIQRLLKLTLETDTNYSSIILKDGDGTILSSLDIAKIIEENQKNLEGQYLDDRLSGLASDLQENEQKEIRTKLGIGDNLQVPLIKISTGFGYNNSVKEKRVRGSFWLDYEPEAFPPSEYRSIAGNKELLIVDFPDFEKYQQQGKSVSLVMERYRGQAKKILTDEVTGNISAISYRKAGFRMESEKDLIKNERVNIFELTGNRTVVDILPEKYFGVLELGEIYNLKPKTKGLKKNSSRTGKKIIRHNPAEPIPAYTSFFVIAFRVAVDGEIISDHICKMKCYCAVNNDKDLVVLDDSISSTKKYGLYLDEFLAKFRIFFDIV